MVILMPVRHRCMGEILLPARRNPGLNCDGFNDRLPLLHDGNGTRISRMQVFSRRGALLFEQMNGNGDATASDGWDGTFCNRPMPQGMYVVVLDLQFRAGRYRKYTW